MKYRIKKETKPTLSTFGKYKAVALHPQTIDSNTLFAEVAKNSPYDKAIVTGLMIKLSEIVSEHLQKGHRVRLREWGLMKLEIESDKVDDSKQFRPKKHIRGVRLHFIPESYKGKQPLYDGITFERDKSVYKDE